jgi:hypothetical protein
MPSVLHELFAKRPDSIAPLLERRLHLPAEDLIAIDSELTAVPEAAARRIAAERDDARFEGWIRRAATATSLDDVFTDE